MIGDLLPDFFADKQLFKEENISLYYFDEYTIGTCVTGKSPSTLYLEINQPKNIKDWKKKENRHTYPNLYYSLNSFNVISLREQQSKNVLRKSYLKGLNSANRNLIVFLPLRLEPR